MKLFSITLLFLSSIKFVSAQFPIDSETGQVKYTDVIELPQISKKQIYDKAKFWIVSTLKSGDNMVELSGTNSDKIVGTGNLNLDSIKSFFGKKTYYADGILNFKFIIFCKENKLKYSVENFLFERSVLNGTLAYDLETFSKKEHYRKGEQNAEYIKYTVNYLDKKIKSLINSFIYEMKKSKSDW